MTWEYRVVDRTGAEPGIIPETWRHLDNAMRDRDDEDHRHPDRAPHRVQRRQVGEWEDVG